MTENMIARFHGLVQEYHGLRDRRVQEHGTRRERFLSLCARGRELVEQRLHALSHSTQEWREHFGPQVPSFDLFEILGISGKENRYTDLLAWLCSRRQHGEYFVHQLLWSAYLAIENRHAGEVRQQAWVQLAEPELLKLGEVRLTPGIPASYKPLTLVFSWRDDPVSESALLIADSLDILHRAASKIDRAG